MVLILQERKCRNKEIIIFIHYVWKSRSATLIFFLFIDILSFRITVSQHSQKKNFQSISLKRLVFLYVNLISQ